MSRKDYEAFAALVKLHLTLACIERKAAAYEVVEEMASGMATLFAQDNARFDRAKFLTACGMEVS